MILFDPDDSWQTVHALSANWPLCAFLCLWQLAHSWSENFSNSDGLLPRWQARLEYRLRGMPAVGCWQQIGG
jgi:hypothetical protein